MWGCTVGVDFIVVALDDRDDWDEGASWMISEPSEKHFDCLFDLDEHWALCWHRCCPEDDFFASARVCDCGESHFAPSVAERVEPDPYFCESVGVFEDKARLFLERDEELGVDVAFARVLWDSEDFGLEFPLLFFWIDSLDLTEFHDGFPRREVPEVVDASLGDSGVDAFLAGECVGDVFFAGILARQFFCRAGHFFSRDWRGMQKNHGTGRKMRY